MFTILNERISDLLLLTNEGVYKKEHYRVDSALLMLANH